MFDSKYILLSTMYTWKKIQYSLIGTETKLKKYVSTTTFNGHIDIPPSDVGTTPLIIGTGDPCSKWIPDMIGTEAFPMTTQLTYS